LARLATVAIALLGVWGLKALGAVPAGTTAFIMENPSDGDSASAATQLQTQLQNAGFSSGNITIGSSLPGSLSGYSQIWDVRYNNTANDIISAANATAYNTYLQSGGKLFLMGENSNFVTRDNSIISFLQNEGSGTITLGPNTILSGTVANSTATIIGPLATTPNTVPTVRFYATGQFSTFGDGTCVVEDPSGNCAGAVWIPGNLTNAPAGMVASILDVNFLTPGTDGTDAQLFTQNLAQFFVSGGAGLVVNSNILSSNSYNASALGSTVNPVFQGGTLVMNQAGTTYTQSFTLDNSGTNTIDQDGNASVFSGVLSNAAANAPGGITLINSHTGGSVTFTGVNTYTGATMINSGATLALSGSGSIATSSGVADNGTFNISATTSGASIASLSGAGAVTLGGQTVRLTSASGTFSGIIAGTGGLTLSGGSETLSGTNSFTGATAIGSGATLALSGSGSIAASSGVADTGTLTIAATTSGATLKSLTGAGAVTLGAKTLALSNAGGTFSGVIAGTGGLTLSGGTETLSGTNSFTGAATIGSGATLALSGSGSIAASSGIGNAGTFDISATTSGASIASLSGAGSVALGAQTLTLSNASGSFSGVIAGTGGLTLSGGTETLTAANSYTGATGIASGALLVLSGSGSVAGSVAAAGTLDISATTSGASIVSLSGPGSVTLGGQTLTLTNAADTFAGTIVGTGGLTVAAGTETLSGVNGFSGATTIASGATLALSGSGNIAASSSVANAGTFDISATTSGASIASLSGAGSVALGAQTLTLTNAADTFSGSIAGTGGLAITAGTETLTGSSTYSGGTSVTGATLQIASDAALGASTAGLALSSGTLVAQAAFTSARPIALSGANAVNAGGNAITLSGTITGTGSVSFTGGGTVTLSGTNQYSGGTTIAGGTTLQIAADAALGASSGPLSLGDASTGGTLLALASFTSARPIVVNAGGGTIDANGNIVTLTGQVTQIGELHTISGTGGEVLLTGPSAVDNLSIGNGTTTNTGTVTAATGVTVASNGSLTNSGTVNTGLLTVDGTATNSGKVTATTGTVVATGGFLSNNGALTSPSLTVNGMLRGTGSVNAATKVTGTLAPGNSPGTLTFTAPVTLTSTATTEFDIDGTGTGTGAGNYSRIVVTGAGNSLTAAGTLEPLLRGITGSATNSFVPSLGEAFTVISAAGGVTGTFATMPQPTGLASGTRLDTIYGATTVTLVVTPASYASLPSIGVPETPDETAVGKVLDTVRPAVGAAPTAAQAAVFMPLYAVPAKSLPPTLDDLSPSIYSDATMTARATWYQMTASVTNQMADRRDNPAPTSTAQTNTATSNTAPGPHGSIIWTNVIGQSDSVATSGAPGYHATVGGAVAGIDVPVAPDALAGFAVGGGSAATSGAGGTDSGAAVQFAVYGGWQFGSFFVDGQAAYLHVDRDVRRNVSFASVSVTGNGEVNGGGGQIEGGMRLPEPPWMIEPTLGVSALGLHADGTTEVGSSTFTEHVGPQDLGSIQSLAAVRVSRQFAITPSQSIRANAQVGWQHEFMDVTAVASASFSSLAPTSFSVSPASISRDAARIGVGFDLPVTDLISAYGSYQAALAQSATSQNLTAGVRVIW
jgi:autotransporter-associated beta strand protein